MDESVELRADPLSLTVSLMRLLDSAEACDVSGSGVLPSLRAGGGSGRAAWYGMGGAPGAVGAWEYGEEGVRLGR